MNNSGPTDVETRNRFLQPTRFFSVLVTALFTLWLLAALAYVFWGRYTHDEGYYSVIAREVWKGRLLYADLRCSQMPLMPYLYGGVLQFLPPHLEWGRAISLLLTFGGLCCGWRLVAARYGNYAGLLGLLTLMLNRPFIFDQTQIRTQALTFFLCSASLFALSTLDLQLRSLSRQSPPDDAGQTVDSAQHGLQIQAWERLACAAGLLAGAGVLARLSLLPFAVAVQLYMIWITHRWCPQAWRRISVKAGICSWGFPFIGGLYFLWRAGDQFTFNVYTYHRLLGAMVGTSQAKLSLGFIVEAIKTQPVWMLWLLLSAALLARNFQGRRQARTKTDSVPCPTFQASSFECFVLAMWIIITTIHVSQRMFSATHQTPLGWAPLILSAYSTRLLVDRIKVDVAASAFQEAFTKACPVLCLIAASVLAWPLQEGELFPSHKDRFRTPAGIYELAAPLRAAPGSTLAAFDTGLAFCAPQVHLLPGYEAGEWAMVPRMDTERQEYFNGVSGRKLHRDLSERADFFVARQWDFVNLNAGDPDFNLDTLNALLPAYHLVYEVPAYGQLNQSITLWRRKTTP